MVQTFLSKMLLVLKAKLTFSLCVGELCADVSKTAFQAKTLLQSRSHKQYTLSNMLTACFGFYLKYHSGVLLLNKTEQKNTGY